MSTEELTTNNMSTEELTKEIEHLTKETEQKKEEEESMEEYIRNLVNRIASLETFVNSSSIFTILNFDALMLQSSASNVNDKLNTLFYEANIPLIWKISAEWIKDDNLIVNTVHVTMLNSFVKEKAKALLSLYFSTVYNNTVYKDELLYLKD
jgi:uncharacterized protein with von Willebrand factor type A (vWA) domain